MYCIDILSVFLITALSMQREIFLSIGLAGICSFTLPMVFGWDIEGEELCISIPSSSSSSSSSSAFFSPCSPLGSWIPGLWHPVSVTSSKTPPHCWTLEK
ncbi:hypothetical protein V6Z93_005202 [Aspergillus fumigatus]